MSKKIEVLFKHPLEGMGIKKGYLTGKYHCSKFIPDLLFFEVEYYNWFVIPEKYWISDRDLEEVK